ncbi:MAG: 23S rRNA (guanosine(2251)-2'-O)-methyltransferase RlmB [Candidatus Pacebacteria bacterium]|nr:23S rRNA (guanosine(2251)-2'-O)-methyltransferase RlmB [Candidatus Paceibacterota bacterium]
MNKESFYIYGKKPIEEQLLRNPENILRIFISDKMADLYGGVKDLREKAKEHRIPVNPVTKQKIKEYVGDVNDQGVIALIKRAEYQDFDEWIETLNIEDNPAVLVLDHIEDIHNFGALVRTAAAVGVAGVIVAKDRQAPINAISYKTSAGTIVKVPIVRVSNINHSIEKLKKSRFWIAAVDMDEEGLSQPLWKHSLHDSPMAFVLGGEGKGVSEKTREHSDYILSIPMENNVESLNVSVAAAVVLYEWKRQQNL